MAGSVSKQTALDQLKACIESMPGLQQAGWESPEFMRWRNDTTAAVRHIFTDEPDRVKDFSWRLSVIHRPALGEQDREESDVFADGLKRTRVTLESMLREVEEFWPDSTGQGAVGPGSGRTVGPSSREVFVVHGHDDGMKNTVARFLEKLELIPVILHERPDSGRTVIEKLLGESEAAAYAVVLLTPDDEGRLRGSGGLPRPRARQNVVFELGYLLGKLGRSRVKALYVEGVELPSDYEGVLYIPVDAGDAWKLQLCREMKQAGLDVDANRAF